MSLAAKRPGRTAKAREDAPPHTFSRGTMKQFWIVTYNHRHGQDSWPEWGSERPDLERVAADLDDWEPDKEEWLDLAGPFEVPEHRGSIASGKTSADLRMEFVFSDIGYQVDLYVGEGDPLINCRDFSGTTTQKQQTEMVGRIFGAVSKELKKIRDSH